MKLVKFQMRHYTTVKLILKSFKNPSGFRRSTASSGIRKNIPRKAYTAISKKVAPVIHDA